MAADLQEKTGRYHDRLAGALEEVTVSAPEDTPMGEAALDCLEMAASYLQDGRHFQDEGDLVNALASFSYGYGWLDCGVRMGLFSIPEETELFTT